MRCEMRLPQRLAIVLAIAWIASVILVAAVPSANAPSDDRRRATIRDFADAKFVR